MPQPKRSTIAESFARWGDADAQLLVEIRDYGEQVREMLAETEALLVRLNRAQNNQGNQCPTRLYGMEGKVSSTE